MRQHSTNEGLSDDGLETADYEEKYRSFIRNSTEGIWRCDTDEPVDTALPEDEQIDAFYRWGFLAEANDAFARMYGFDQAEQLIGARLSDLLVQNNPQNVEYLRAFIRSGYRLEDAASYETDREGNPRVFSNTLTGILRDGRLVRAWGTQRDITQQKHLEEALRASEARFRAVFEQAVFPILVFSLDGNPVMVNQASADFFGAATEELLKFSREKGFNSGPFSFLSSLLPQESGSALAGEEHRTVRNRYKRNDGTECWAVSTTTVLRDGQGEATGFLVTFSDVTAQAFAERRREEALADLEESKERLRLALASGEMGTWDADLINGTLTLSEEIAPLYGRPRGEVTLSVAEWVGWLHPEERERVAAAFAAALRGDSDYDIQFRTLWPDGSSYRWIGTRALITRDADGTPLRAVGYTRNVTREKEQEAEREALLLRQRQFMREFVFSLTEGKFRLCLSEADLPVSLLAASEVIVLTTSTLRSLRVRLNQVTEGLDFLPERAQDIETAVGEAAMNAATHGGGGEGLVCTDLGRSVVQIWIRDRGVGISEEALPRVLGKGVSSAGTLGHGFWLMLGTCDRVFLLSGPEGTTVVLEQERIAPEPAWLQNVGG